MNDFDTTNGADHWDENSPDDTQPIADDSSTADPPEDPIVLPGMVATNKTYIPNDLEEEQAKALPVIESYAGTTKPQHKALGNMRDCVAKAPQSIARIELHGERKARKSAVLKDVREEADERTLFGRIRTVDIPPVGKWIAAPILILLFTALHRAMLLFLGLPLGLTTLFAIGIAVALEALAMVYGRSAAARDRARVAELQLSHTAKILLRIAPPIAMAIEVSIGILRALLTGQWVTSVVLSLAGVALWWVSAYLSEHSYSGDAVHEKRAEKAEEKETELRSQAEGDYEKLRQQWHQSRDLVLQGAAVQLGRIQSLTARVDAGIRRAGRKPAPWPLTAPIAQQMAWARGKFDASLTFPSSGDDPAAKASPQEPNGPPELPSGRAA